MVSRIIASESSRQPSTKYIRTMTSRIAVLPSGRPEIQSPDQVGHRRQDQEVVEQDGADQHREDHRRGLDRGRSATFRAVGAASLRLIGRARRRRGAHAGSLGRREPADIEPADHHQEQQCGAPHAAQRLEPVAASPCSAAGGPSFGSMRQTMEIVAMKLEHRRQEARDEASARNSAEMLVSVSRP